MSKPERPKFGMLPPQPVVSPREAARNRNKRRRPRNIAKSIQELAALQTNVASGTPSYVEQARALKNNVDLIYEFVHDQIDFIPNYGLHKGGLGALIDGSGNAFDQCDLMIQLLRQTIPDPNNPENQIPAYTAKYVTGSLKLSASQWSNWLGLSDTSLTLASQLLANGGIGNTPNSSTNELTLEHCWVQVTIGGTDYVFDPAFKAYNNVSGVDVKAAMDYDTSTFLSRATSGYTLNSDYVQNINDTNIVTDMKEFSNNLIDWIKANAPAASMDEILGGRSIVGASTTPLRQTDLSYRDTGTTPTVATDLSSDKKATMRIRYLQNGSTYRIDYTAYAADIYGKRLTLWFDSSYIAKLYLNGTVVADSSTSQSQGAESDMIITVDHPYAQDTVDADATYTTTIVAGVQTTIGTVWGISSREMTARHQEQQNDAIAAGTNDEAEALLGQSLLLIWDNLTGQASKAMDIACRLSNCTTVVHHFVGTITSRPYGAGRIKSINSFLGAYNVSALDGMTDAGSVGVATALLFQMLEGSTQQQVTGIESADPIKTIQKANASGYKIYDARTSNWTSGIGVKGILNTAGYDSATLTAIENNFINATPSWRVAIPENPAIPIGGMSNFYGYLGIGSSTSGMNVIGQNWFSAKGSVSAGYQSDPSTNAASADNARQPNGFGMPAATAYETARVNMLNGRYEYSCEDLNVGNQGMPYALSFVRSYNSALRLTFQGMGFGWTHNWMMKASKNSDGFIGFGDQQVLEAASAIATIFVTRDVAKNDSNLPLKNIVIMCAVQQYLSSQLADNVVRLNLGTGMAVFTKLPDGTSYLPSPGMGRDCVLTYNTSTSNYVYTTAEKVVYTFRTTGEISTIAFPFGITLTFTYDSSNRLKKISNGFRELNITLDTYGQLETVHDGNGRVVTYTIDYATGNLTQVKDPLNKSTTYEYDQRGRLTKIFKPANPTSPIITNTYDSLSRVKEQKDAYNNVWKFYLAGSRSEEVAPNNTSRIMYFNAKGSTLRAINALGQKVVTTYDGLERPTLVTAPEGNSISTVYDDDPTTGGGNGYVKSVTQHAKPGSGLSDRTMSFTYDSVWTSKPHTMTDAQGNVSTTTYAGVSQNGAGKPITVEQPAVGGQTPTTTFTYNSIGQLLTTTDPTGRVVANEYTTDGKNNLSKTRIDPSGLNIVTEYTSYDAVGNVLTTKDPKGHTTTTVYDSNRRVTQVTGPSPFSQVSYITYDYNGNVIQTQSLASSDSNSQITTTTYAIDGKVATVVGPSNSPDGSAPVPVRYEYDELRRAYKVTDASGHVAITTFDSISRPVSSAVDGVTQSSITYSDNGKVLSLTDARNNTTTYEYDGFDRLVKTTYPDSSSDYETVAYDVLDRVTSTKTRAGVDYDFTYDVLGRMLAKEPDGAPTVTYTYDLAGRPLTVSIPTVSGDPSTGTFSMFYDNAGRMFKEQYPDGKTVIATMDADGNVTTLQYPDGSQLTQVFDELDGVTSISGFGGSVAFGYDSASRRESQVAGNNVGTGYRYDKVDNLLSLTIAGLKPSSIPTPAKVDFAYAINDAGQSLTKKCSDTGFLWEPSLTKTITYGTANNLNQYPTVDSVAFSYDNNGCLTSDGTNTYGYDIESRLTSVTTPSNTVGFKYDPFGRLVQKTVGSVKTRYLYSGMQRIEEYDDSGTLLRRYVYGTSLDECLYVVDVATSTVTYLHSDETGSTIMTTDSSGTPTRRNVYTPYGDLASGSLSGITIGYTGQFYEPEIDLYFYKARHYSPKLGRFLQPDPVGYRDSLNMYEYGSSDPVNFSDPLGLGLLGTIGGFFGGIGRLIGNALDVALRFAPLALAGGEVIGGPEFWPLVPVTLLAAWELARPRNSGSGPGPASWNWTPQSGSPTSTFTAPPPTTLPPPERDSVTPGSNERPWIKTERVYRVSLIPLHGNKFRNNKEQQLYHIIGNPGAPSPEGSIDKTGVYKYGIQARGNNRLKRQVSRLRRLYPDSNFDGEVIVDHIPNRAQALILEWSYIMEHAANNNLRPPVGNPGWRPYTM